MIQPIRLAKEHTLLTKVKSFNWVLLLLIFLLASIGFLSLYSAAGGTFHPWAAAQAKRFALGLGLMFFIGFVPIKAWHQLSWPAYFGGLCLLIAVEAMGHVGMGAQRWIDLGFIRLQPSELMKIAVIMVLARYYHATTPRDTKYLKSLIVPLVVIILPVALVMLQPDLGTALMIVMAGSVMIFLAGAPLWWFGVALAAVLAAVPVIWQVLHDYQKQRVLTFLNPESDPLGAGYHITQSKIALGSGGMQGKGFLGGSQSHLNFLPEKQTDFIFTLWAEEWGFIGGAGLLFLCGCIFGYGLWVALNCKYDYGRFLAFGVIINFSLYVFINIAMVMGLIPVVGVPLPLVSYGGTAMLAALIGFGLLISTHMSRDMKSSRY